MVKSSDVFCDLDLKAPGRGSGSYFVPHSANGQPFGFRGPIGVLNGAPGPTLTLVGGVHGDEYQGPIVISRLFHELSSGSIKGRILFLPALNTPAFDAGTRCSPLDGGNMNRAFDTERAAQPTSAIAGWFEDTILAQSDAVIDFHAGGRTSVFAPVTMMNSETEENLDLAHAFGLPLIWRLGPMNSSTSVNAAAQRAGVPMIACELGGAGGTDVATNRLAYDGAIGVLRHLGMIERAEPRPKAACVHVDLPARENTVRAPKQGVFEPMVEPGAWVKEGDGLGVIRDIIDLGQPPVEVTTPVSGLVGMRVWRGAVSFGEALAVILRRVTAQSSA